MAWMHRSRDIELEHGVAKRMARDALPPGCKVWSPLPVTEVDLPVSFLQGVPKINVVNEFSEI